MQPTKRNSKIQRFQQGSRIEVETAECEAAALISAGSVGLRNR